MSDDLIRSIDELLVTLLDDTKKQQKRFEKYEHVLEEKTEKKNLEGAMIMLDKFSIIQIVQNRILANMQTATTMKILKALVLKSDNLTKALSKLPDRQEFDALKNTL